MKRFLVVAVMALVGVIALSTLGYLVGYWPEHRRRQALEAQVVSLQAQVTSLNTQLEGSQTRVRLAGLLGQVLTAEDAVSAQNYGQAQAVASEFFDAARAEGERTAPGSAKDALVRILEMRDAVTAALTRGDPESLRLLRDADAVLRSELQFPSLPTP